MTFTWQKAFTKTTPAWKDGWTFASPVKVSTLSSLKHFLDFVHIKHCLLKPFFEQPDYPIVETRELLPSFEVDMWEFKNLPGFSLVALARPLDYFAEVFQFDILHPVPDSLRSDIANTVIARNTGTFLSRLPRVLQDSFRADTENKNITDLNHYPQLMPLLGDMDRAQVMGMFGSAQEKSFYLSGVYASLPSDLDTEIKRYGLRIGKFSLDNPELYEQNRAFVCQHLMELYGYPFSSERRTSAALFARKLHKMGEKFLIRSLSQSDRVITTNWSMHDNTPYPQVEKIALISVDADYEQLNTLRDEGYLIDEKRRIVILRVTYKQHKFSKDNVRQERALSVERQEVIHPLTGVPLVCASIIRDSTNMILRLNDIVRGEHTGRIAYKRNEIIGDTRTEKNRLKFLYAWFTKHQRRMIGYSDDFFTGINQVITGYLYPVDIEKVFPDELEELRQEVIVSYSYILQARTIRILEDLADREMRGEKIGYAQMLIETVAILHALKFEIVSYFDSLVVTAISIGENILNDYYLRKTYADKIDDDLTPNGVEIKRNYRKLVALVDELQSIRKSRFEVSRTLNGIDTPWL